MADLGPGANLSTSRRTLVRGAAWTVPVVAVAATAPALAASPCSTTYPYRLNWGTPGSSFARASARSATALATAAGAGAVTVTFTSVSTTAANVPDPARNLTVPPSTGTATLQDPVITSLGGASGEQGMRLHHTTSTAGSGIRQTLTIGFSRTVTGLSFAITDIDNLLTSGYQYADRVYLSGDTIRTQTLDGLRGTGTSTDPWRRTDDRDRNIDGNVNENSAGAKVTVTYTAPVDVLTLDYYNLLGGTQYHRIFLGDFTFTALGC